MVAFYIQCGALATRWERASLWELFLIHWAKFKCPQGASYNDGCANSRIGPPQRPGLFSGYKVRPPWNVAGVDYYVGMPAGATMIAAMKDWTTLGSTPGIDILGTTVRCDGTYATTPTSGPVTLDLIDFSLHGGATLSVPAGGCSGLTVTQSKFGNTGGTTGCSNGSPSSYYLIHNQNPGASLTVQYNTFDMTNCQMGVASVIYASGNSNLQYNYFLHLQGQVLQAGSGPYSIDYRYNLVDSLYYTAAPSNHMNWQEFGGAVGDVSDLVAFNTAYMPSLAPSMGAGEGWQFYGNSGGRQTGATLSNNTVVSYDTGQCQSNQNGCVISYWVHGHGAYSPATTLVPTAYLQDNYLDPRGMIGSSGQAYPGSVTGWTCSGNINMNTGATINEGC